MKVAAPVACPRPAQAPRRDRNLTILRSDHRLKRRPRDPRRIVTRLDVLQDGHSRALGKPERAPLGRSPELALRLVPDGWHPLVDPEIGAVCDYRGIDPVVPESARFPAYREPEPQRLARLKRPFQGINPVTELVVVQHGTGGAAEFNR